MRGAQSVVLAASLALQLAACQGTKLEREGSAAVRAYNEALIVAYRTNSPRGLEEVAGEKEVRRLIALIDLKRGGNLALESQLEAFDVLSVEPTGSDRLTARTRERWRYWDRPLKPGMPTGPVFVAEMWMAWELRREAQRWKVEGGTTERSEYLEPKGFRPNAEPRAGPAATAQPAAAAKSTS